MRESHHRLIRWFHASRLVAWIAFGCYAMLVATDIQHSIPVLFFLSLYANIASEGALLVASFAEKAARDR